LLTCLLAYGVQVWSTQTVNNYREDQVGALKDRREVWIEGSRSQRTDHGWLTLGDIDRQEYMWRSGGMLTKSRRWLTKSRGDARGLGDRAVEDDCDTCQHRGGGVVDMLLQGV
jgi:hypothetical protein